MKRYVAPFRDSIRAYLGRPCVYGEEDRAGIVAEATEREVYVWDILTKKVEATDKVVVFNDDINDLDLYKIDKIGNGESRKIRDYRDKHEKFNGVDYVLDHRDLIYFSYYGIRSLFFGRIVNWSGDGEDSVFTLENSLGERKEFQWVWTYPEKTLEYIKAKAKKYRMDEEGYIESYSKGNKDRPEEKINKGYNRNIRSKDMGFDLGQIVGMKMLSALTSGKDIDLGKLMLVQSLAGGQPIEIGDVMKAKLMSAIAKDDNSLEDLPLDKLIMYKMFDSGNIDINQIIQLKLMTKLLDEEEK